MAQDTEPHVRPLLSVVMPVYNEFGTVERILTAVRNVDVDKEIIVVDDCSNDGTRELLRDIAATDGRVRVLYHDVNRGKGAALRTAIAAARGQYVVVQDADMEYDPNEYPKLLRPVLEGRADVVYGSRFAGGEDQRMPNFWHSIGNRILTRLSNMFTNLSVSDMETCYKVIRREIIQDIVFEENRFGFEPEITAKIARYRVDGRPLRIHEVGISYRGRTYEEGKKIGWKDGVRALWCIVKYNWFKRH
jgi:glycosyltransferase involved in cell wall biosynthesis